MEKYVDQKQRWPHTSRHILAHFDEETIVVYQAYCRQIGWFAVEHQQFGDGFSYQRMSWIKPNFLWMMHRSHWGQSPNQEMVLAIRLRRSFFDSILEQAVSSSYVPELYASLDAWKSAVANSDVRLQWDPDHEPSGAALERRAIQLGLRGSVLESYGKREIVEIIDLSEFVAGQRSHREGTAIEHLMMPREQVYRPAEAIAARLGLDCAVTRCRCL